MRNWYDVNLSFNNFSTYLVVLSLGGILLAAAHFGANVLGIEIRYNVARAVGKSSRQGEISLALDQSIFSNFEQYELIDKFLGVVIADSSRHTIWRTFTGTMKKNDDGIFDAILTDRLFLLL